MNSLVLFCINIVLLVNVMGWGEATIEDGHLLERWNQFKAQYKKSYNSATETRRYAAWLSNVKLIEQHNAEAAKGGHSFTLGENEYADLDATEYKVLLGLKTSPPSRYRRSSTSYSPGTYAATVPTSSLPTTVNWTQRGWVNPVQNQGQCGDCWAFASCGALEGQYYNVTGTSVILSEQNLLDCSGPQGNAGCNGGNMENAFNYVRINAGIDTSSSYPYTGAQSQTCAYNEAYNAATITGWMNVLPFSIPSLQQAVAQVGPIAVGFDASSPSFQLYKTGVYAPSVCSPQTQRLDHAMLAVGYGKTTNGTSYWIIKNSWGTSWGIQGYVWVAMANNTCGVATSPSFPTGLRGTGLKSTNGVSPLSYGVTSLYAVISLLVSTTLSALCLDV